VFAYALNPVVNRITFGGKFGGKNMARGIHKLSARTVASASEPGKLGDGGGLVLQVARGGSKSWLFRFMVDGREHVMGLGPYPAVSLADAREKAASARKQRAEGVDPLAAKRAQRASARSALTFADCAGRYIAAHEASWENAEHRRQWRATLQQYVHPFIGALPVVAVDTDAVRRALEPIWTAKPETAGRVRGRIESVLDWATANKLRNGDNPARWKGHLEHLLAERVKVPVHHAALPYAALPNFMTMLRQQAGVAARALEFAILTAARAGEVFGARWEEVDLAAAVWTVPAERMKGGRIHRVPLSDPARAVLAATGTKAGLAFTAKRGKPLPPKAMRKVLERMGRSDATPHGFRSTFRDWAAERTDFAGEVIEMALAHAVRNKAEAAYRRGDLFEKRRALMDKWSTYCGGRT
jgi:integrase